MFNVCNYIIYIFKYRYPLGFKFGFNISFHRYMICSVIYEITFNLDFDFSVWYGSVRSSEQMCPPNLHYLIYKFINNDIISKTNPRLESAGQNLV